MFQSRGICALSCCLISFLRSWEACLCWDLLQTKVNLFLSNKAMWVPSLCCGTFLSLLPFRPGSLCHGFAPRVRSALCFTAVRGPSRQVGHQPGGLQPQPSARLRAAERVEAGERCQGNSLPVPTRTRVLCWQCHGETLVLLRASIWPSSGQPSL